MQPLGKFETRILLDLKCHLFLLQEDCPIRIMFIASLPLNVRRAVLNEPNPILGLTNRFIARYKKFHNIIGCVATPGGDLVKASSPSNEDARFRHLQTSRF